MIAGIMAQLKATRWVKAEGLAFQRTLDRLYGAAVLGVLGLALFLRLLGLHKGIWLDEWATLEVILGKSFAETMRAIQADNHPPLYFALLWIWSRAGTEAGFLRLPSVISGLGTVAAVIFWVRPYHRLGSLLAGLLCATLPLMLFHSQEIRHYSLLAFTTALALYFAGAILADPQKSGNYTGLALSLTAAVATHLLGILVLAAVAIYLAATPSTGQRDTRDRLAKTLLVPCFAFAFFYFYFLRELGSNTSNWWVPPVSLNLLAYTSNDVFGVDRALFPVRALGRFQALVEGTVLFINIAFFVFLASLTIFGKWRQSFPLLAAVAVFWAGLAGYSVLVKPLLLSRTALPGLVPLAGFTGIQAATVMRRELRLAAVLFLLGLSLLWTVNWVKYEAGTAKERWAELAGALQLEWQPLDLVVFYPSYIQGPVGYYLPELPEDQEMALNVGEGPGPLEAYLNYSLDGPGKPSARQSLFLVVRRDTLVEKDQESFSQIQSTLRSRFGDPVSVQTYGDLFLLKYPIR